MMVSNKQPLEEEDFGAPLPPPSPVKAKGRGMDLSGGTGRIVLLSALVTIVLLVLMSVSGGVVFVTKKDFTANMAGLLATMEQAKADLTKSQSAVTSAIQSVPATVANQVSASIAQATSQWNSQLSTVNASVQNNTAALNSAKAEIATLKEKVSALEIQVADLKAKLAAPSSSGGGGTTIPGVTISATVTEEGVLQADGTTVGEIKLALANAGTTDIVDVVLSIYVYFDGCADANQIISAASYGSWSIRESSRSEIQLKGRLARLTVGQSRRVYIDIVSVGVDNKVTYLDTSTSDVEVVDWNYAD